MAKTRFWYIFMGCFVYLLLTLIAEEDRCSRFLKDESHIYFDLHVEVSLRFFTHTLEQKAPSSIAFTST